MYKKNILILYFLFTGINLNAQTNDSLAHKYDNQTIYRYGGYFQKGNERFSFQGLAKEFSMSGLGLDLYTKAKKQRTTSLVLNTVALASGLASIAVISNNNGNRPPAFILLGGQIVFSIGARRYSLLSQQSLDRAIWQRNKDVLFPQK